MRSAVRSWRVALVVAWLAGCTATPPAPAESSTLGPETLARVDGAELARVRLADGSTGYLQRIDVTRMRIDQVLGDQANDAGPVAPGAYYPGAPSPRFRRITVEQMQASCRERYGAKAFSAVNFSFFEEYDPSTRLSFPVKTGGMLVTGGSSPYGPVPSPKDPRYRGVQLTSLSWDDHGVAIAPFDPGTGAPLNRSGTREALVTYRFADHPAHLLGGDPANRYQLLGVSDAMHLLMLTVEHTSLTTAASLLREQGARGDILTSDGGISTFLWSGTRGDLVKVTNRDGALPHYLCLHGAS